LIYKYEKSIKPTVYVKSNMNLFVGIMFLSFLAKSVESISINNCVLRNAKYRLIIFSKKNLPKMIGNAKYYLKNQYKDVIDVIHKYVFEYNALSDADKELIDFILSSMF
jgi:hypothetical protein